MPRFPLVVAFALLFIAAGVFIGAAVSRCDGKASSSSDAASPGPVFSSSVPPPRWHSDLDSAIKYGVPYIPKGTVFRKPPPGARVYKMPPCTAEDPLGEPGVGCVSYFTKAEGDSFRRAAALFDDSFKRGLIKGIRPLPFRSKSQLDSIKATMRK